MVSVIGEINCPVCTHNVLNKYQVAPLGASKAHKIFRLVWMPVIGELHCIVCLRWRVLEVKQPTVLRMTTLAITKVQDISRHVWMSVSGNIDRLL